MNTAISFVTNLQAEGMLVFVAHVLAWLYCTDRVWNMSDMPPSELADIRQQFASPQVVLKPFVLVANTLWRRLLREATLLFCFLGLASNYFQSHKSWAIAAAFLGFVILAVEVLSRFNCRRYRQNLYFCDRIRKARAAAVNN